MSFTDHDYITIPEKVDEQLAEIARKQTEGNKDTRDFDTDNYEKANYKGLCGEWVFSAYYGVQFEPEIARADDNYDFELEHIPSGTIGKVDVKCIEFEGGDLLVRAWKKLTASHYFLTEKRNRDVGLIGVATRDMVDNAKIYPEGVYSPVKVRRVPRDKLIPAMHPKNMKGVN